MGGLEAEDTKGEIDKVYRKNSRFPRIRNVLRDVLVHFVNKKKKGSRFAAVF